MCMSRIKARSEAYALSDESSSIRAWVLLEAGYAVCGSREGVGDSKSSGSSSSSSSSSGSSPGDGGGRGSGLSGVLGRSLPLELGSMRPESVPKLRV